MDEKCSPQCLSEMCVCVCVFVFRQVKLVACASCPDLSSGWTAANCSQSANGGSADLHTHTCMGCPCTQTLLAATSEPCYYNCHLCQQVPDIIVPFLLVCFSFPPRHLVLINYAVGGHGPSIVYVLNAM